MALNLSVVLFWRFCLYSGLSPAVEEYLYSLLQSLKRGFQLIASDNDVETKVEQMNIQEFDDNFALLDKMKSNILLLLDQGAGGGKKRSELEIRVMLGEDKPPFPLQYAGYAEMVCGGGKG